uniref:Uncharacterized protein n=1 Tax=Lactuca sativa TaxID=4236 RepID=A0A9R1VE54_LACSA|nr:hypothetical protein LSAT_V11C500237060 [Lactuca sativa]
MCFGGNTIVPIVFKIFSIYLAAPEFCFCLLIDIGDDKELRASCFNGNPFQDPHPRVSWATINAFGHLSTNLGPYLQNQYHHLVLPVLASVMDDFHNPQVDAHATSTVLKFSESWTSELLQPYLDGIVGKLLVLLSVCHCVYLMNLLYLKTCINNFP